MPEECLLSARQWPDRQKRQSFCLMFFWAASKGKGSTREGRVKAHMDVTERQRPEEQKKILRGTDRKTEIH